MIGLENGKKKNWKFVVKCSVLDKLRIAMQYKQMKTDEVLFFIVKFANLWAKNKKEKKRNWQTEERVDREIGG